MHTSAEVFSSMMYAAGVRSSRDSVISSMGSMRSGSFKPMIAIKLSDEDSPGYKSPPAYTTGDTIAGEVIITASQDTRFDDIAITFEGTTRTWAERYNSAPTATSRINVSHTFLKLIQPVDESLLPIPRVAEKGRTYTLPFTFVVPEHLLPAACSHATENGVVKAEHQRLPPSLGDRAALPSDTDDFAPDMVKICYAVRVRMARRKDNSDKPAYLAEATKSVRVMPAVEEAPPVHVSAGEVDPEFVLSKEKQLSEGMFKKKKTGKLSVSAEQPRPLQLSLTCRCPPTTMVPISLTFTPADDSMGPPSLGRLTTKLRVNTFYSTYPLPFSPKPSRAGLGGPVGGGNYPETVTLSARCMAGANWVPSESGGRRTYTLRLPLPVEAPKCRTLVPSFESCLVCRSYALELALKVAGGPVEKTLTLKIPLQVSLPVASSAGEESQTVEEFFTPRNVAPPPAGQAQPPDYSVRGPAGQEQRMLGISPAG